MAAPVDTGTGTGARWLRYVPPVAALSVAFVLQVIVVCDTVGTALARNQSDTGTWPWVWYVLAALLGTAVASSLEAGAAYLMWLYDRHLRARDSVWQLRVGMVAYVAVSFLVIHWWLGQRGLPELIAYVLGGMSASSLWLWSRGSRWAQRQEMIAAGQIDPALPRLHTTAKVFHPIRWVATVWLISWEPVSTTDEARARYQAWKDAKQAKGTKTAWTRRLPETGSARTASDSSSARSSAGTETKPPVTDAGSESPGPLSRRSSKPRTKTTTRGSKTQSDTELASHVVANGWTELSQNALMQHLQIGKTKAKRVKALVDEMRTSSPSNPSANGEPSPAPAPVSNGKPTNPETAAAAVLATS